MKKHAMRLFFEDAEFPQASQEDEMFAECVEDSVRKAFLRADLALADDSVINRSSGTTALTALILGRLVGYEKKPHCIIDDCSIAAVLMVFCSSYILQATFGCKCWGLPCSPV